MTRRGGCYISIPAIVDLIIFFQQAILYHEFKKTRVYVQAYTC